MVKCEHCNGKGFMIIKLKDWAVTAINIRYDYPICPVCKGSGEKPWSNVKTY